MSAPYDQTALPHADLETLAAMRADCAAASENLPMARAARRAVRPAPSIHYDDFPRGIAKPEIRVDEAAARLARALHLGLE